MSPIYLHHAVLHFPIGLIAAAGFLYLLSFVQKWKTLEAPAYIILLLGIIAGMAAAIPGFLSAEHLIEDGVAPSLVASHRNSALLGMSLALLAGVSLVWPKRRKYNKVLNIVGKLFSILAALVILFAAHRGGEMIHPSIQPFSTEHEHQLEGDHHGTGENETFESRDHHDVLEEEGHGGQAMEHHHDDNHATDKH